MRHAGVLLVLITASAITGSCRGGLIPPLPPELQLQSWLQEHISPWLGRSLLQRARGGAAGASSSSSSGQQQASSKESRGGVPMCVWSDVKEICTPTQLVYLSLNAPPTTLVHRAATTAYDRNLVCNGHPDASSCHKDRANRCFYWNRSCVGMDAFEAVNWLNTASPLDGDAALLDFTCPGTVAAQYKSCRTASEAGPKGICNSLPGCQFVALMKECVPTSFDSKQLSELQGFTKAFKAFDAGMWGSCEGACYVRQAAACRKAYNTTSDCRAKSYCVWQFEPNEGREVCVHRDTASQASDAYSKEYAAVKESCAKLKSQTACEVPKVKPRSVGKFRQSKAAAGGATDRVVTESGATCVI